MALKKENVSDSVVVALAGDFDAHAVSEARPELEELVGSGAGKIVFNLENLNFIDSTGIGLIVHVYKRLKAGNGSLRIAGATGQPAELITILKVDQVIELFDDVASACNGR